MNEFEKAYIIFFWLHDNISYDIEKKETGKAAYMPNDVYNKGKCVCEGYSKLFQYIGQEIGLKIIFISGYAPDTVYKNKYENHAWNILQVNQKNYLIDTTWGSGFTKNNKYEKKLNEFYFCSNPEYFIFTHLPDESKWQLLKLPIGIEEFQKRVKFNSTFFEYFKGSNVIHNIIITKNENTIRLYKKNPEVKISVYLTKEKDDDYSILNVGEEMVTDTEKYIDIKCIFPEKSIYQLKISVNTETINEDIGKYTFIYINAVNFKIEYLDDAEKDFRYGELNNKESLEHDEIMASLNKDKINLIINKAPNRKNSSLNNFIEYLKKETKDLNEFEKAYTLFRWIYKNISYDESNCHVDEKDYQKIYKKEKLKISYCKMYTFILKQIGLNIFEIDGYTKNTEKWHYSDLILDINSSWNILEVKGSYYIIFSSIYLNVIDNEDVADFYFCSKPEHFIKSYLPKYPKWQLLEKPLKIEEFQNGVYLCSHYFFYYFKSIDPENYVITAEKRCSVKVYKKNQKNEILSRIFSVKRNGKYERGETFIEDLNCKRMVIDRDDCKEIKCIFNKKGKFYLRISGNDGSSRSYKVIAEYIIQCNECLNDNEFDFLPEDYNEGDKIESGNNRQVFNYRKWLKRKIK